MSYVKSNYMSWPGAIGASGRIGDPAGAVHTSRAQHRVRIRPQHTVQIKPRLPLHRGKMGMVAGHLGVRPGKRAGASYTPGSTGSGAVTPGSASYGGGAPPPNPAGGGSAYDDATWDQTWNDDWASEGSIEDQEAAAAAAAALPPGTPTPPGTPEAAPAPAAPAPKKPMTTAAKVGIAAGAGWLLLSFLR